jgi:hypothetical protein
MTIVIIACCIWMAGCVGSAAKRSAALVQATEARYTQLMRDAESALKNNQKDQALGLFANAAKTSPTRLEPWQRMSQIQFEHGNYVEAAVAAQEVLQRDAPTADGAAAHSILAVSGLRLSVRSLAELRGNDFLNGDVRREAETLAQTLRVTLNEPVLVPTLVDGSDAQGATPLPQSTLRKRKSPKSNKSVSTDKPAAVSGAAKASVPKGNQAVQSVKDAVPAGAVSGDPFGALK